MQSSSRAILPIRQISLLFTLLTATLQPGCSSPAPSIEAGVPNVLEVPKVAEGTSPLRHTVEVDGHPIAVWQKSPANQPTAAINRLSHTVLLVHGRTWSSLPDFDLQVSGEQLSLMDGLTAAGITTYAVDMRGYGQTPRDASGWLTPNRAAADLAGVMRWLNARLKAEGHAYKAHLFGWSYGSMMGQLMVQQQPELAASLILFGYPVRVGVAADDPDQPSTAPAMDNTAKNAASDFITPNSISQHAIDTFVAAALKADPQRTDWRMLKQWQALDATRVSTPTLLLQGEFDPYTNQDAHQRLFDRLDTNDKLWFVVKGGDHAAFMETPRQEFLDTMVGFIRGH